MLVPIWVSPSACLRAVDAPYSTWEDLRQLRAGQQIQVVEMSLRSVEAQQPSHPRREQKPNGDAWGIVMVS